MGTLYMGSLRASFLFIQELLLFGFFNKSYWENWTAMCGKNEIRKFFNTIHKNKLKMDCNGCVQSHFSRVQLFVTLWTTACQPPLSMRFSRQDSWSGLPCPPPWDFPNSGMEPMSLMSPALAGGFFTTSATCVRAWKIPGTGEPCELPSMGSCRVGHD